MDTPWHSQANEIARFNAEHRVMRWDINGAYYTTGETTVGQKTEYGKLDFARLVRHCQATKPEDVIGIHTTVWEDGKCWCKWAIIDIDYHDHPGDSVERNFKAALHWFYKLQELGFKPILFDSNGKGGFHILILFSERVPSEWLFAFGECLLSDYADLGFEEPPEFFPKQRRITQSGPGSCGNWVRLPGRHSKSKHYSIAYHPDEKRWMNEGEILSYTT